MVFLGCPHCFFGVLKATSQGFGSKSPSCLLAADGLGKILVDYKKGADLAKMIDI